MNASSQAMPGKSLTPRGLIKQLIARQGTDRRKAGAPMRLLATGLCGSKCNVTVHMQRSSAGTPIWPSRLKPLTWRDCAGHSPSNQRHEAHSAPIPRMRRNR